MEAVGEVDGIDVMEGEEGDESLRLGRSLGGTLPGRGRPSPAGRPASDGLGEADGGLLGRSGSADAWVTGGHQSSRVVAAMVIAHRVWSFGVTRNPSRAEPLDRWI